MKTKIKIDHNEVTLHERIGRGNFGQVFRGNIPNNLNVAVKVIYFKNIEDIEEIQNELKILNIIGKPYYFGSYLDRRDQTIYIVTQYFNLDNLYDYVLNNELSEETKKRFTIDILKRLKNLDKLKIIHRDVKPENFVVHLDDQLSIHIIDFGFSCVSEEDEGDVEEIRGTPLYMSPQLFEKRFKTNMATIDELKYNDIYGAAICIYFIYTKKILCFDDMIKSTVLQCKLKPINLDVIEDESVRYILNLIFTNNKINIREIFEIAKSKL